MESFEQFVALAMEAESLVVSEAVKFPLVRQTAVGPQVHGYEVDLVGARSGLLVLATVKSFLGSRGVAAEDVIGTTANERANGFTCCSMTGTSGVESYGLRRNGTATARTKSGSASTWVGSLDRPTVSMRRRSATGAGQKVGGGPVEVFGLADVIAAVRKAAVSKTYRDNPVLVTMKVLQAAGLLRDVEISLLKLNSHSA